MSAGGPTSVSRRTFVETVRAALAAHPEARHFDVGGTYWLRHELEEVLEVARGADRHATQAYTGIYLAIGAGTGVISLVLYLAKPPCITRRPSSLIIPMSASGPRFWKEPSLICRTMQQRDAEACLNGGW